MDEKDMIDMALSKLGGEMEDMEGKSAMTHEEQHCLDPMSCDEHNPFSMDRVDSDGRQGSQDGPAAEGVEIDVIEPKSLGGGESGEKYAQGGMVIDPTESRGPGEMSASKDDLTDKHLGASSMTQEEEDELRKLFS